MTRSINRFRNYLKSEEHILFVIKCHGKDNKYKFPFSRNMTTQEAIQLKNVLKKVCKNFTLLIVNESNKEEVRVYIDNLIIDWIIGPYYKGDNVLENTEKADIVNYCNYGTPNVYDKQWKRIFREASTKNVHH